MINLRLFGVPSLWIGDTEVSLLCKKAWSVIGFIAVAGGRPVSRARIAGEIWPDLDEDHARQALATTVWRLGKALSVSGLTTDDLFLRKGELLTLAPPDVLACDSREFRRLLQGHNGSGSNGNLPCDLLEVGIALQTAPFMEAIGDFWCMAERESLRVLHINALDRLMNHFTACGEHESVLRLGRQLLCLEPYLEHVHRALITALGLLGERALAAHQFAICETMLRKELQVAPLPETVQAYCRAIGVSASVSPVTTNVRLTGSHSLKAPENARRQALENLRTHLIEARKELDNLDR